MQLQMMTVGSSGLIKVLCLYTILYLIDQCIFCWGIMYIVHLMVKYKQNVRSKQKQANVKLLHCFIILCVDLCEPSLLQCSCVLLGNCHNVSNTKSNKGNECMYTWVNGLGIWSTSVGVNHFVYGMQCDNGVLSLTYHCGMFM